MHTHESAPLGVRTSTAACISTSLSAFASSVRSLMRERSPTGAPSSRWGAARRYVRYRAIIDKTGKKASYLA